MLPAVSQVGEIVVQTDPVTPHNAALVEARAAAASSLHAHAADLVQVVAALKLDASAYAGAVRAKPMTIGSCVNPSCGLTSSKELTARASLHKTQRFLSFQLRCLWYA